MENENLTIFFCVFDDNNSINKSKSFINFMFENKAKKKIRLYNNYISVFLICLVLFICLFVSRIQYKTIDDYN